MPDIGPPPSPRPPDVVLVVLDTVRKDVLSGGGSPAPGQPTLDDLRERCWVHPRAIAPAPWTVPSHTSIFSGLPPWEHHVHIRGRSRRLAAGQTTLAQSLQELGYRTASFASNNLVGPVTGLHRGFDWWAAGGRQDWLLRGLASPPSESCQANWVTKLGKMTHLALQEPIWSLIARWPGPVDALATMLHQFQDDPSSTEISGWIDQRMRHWLATVPAERPTFVFVNLMEAHEPYFGLRTARNGFQGATLRRRGAPRADSRNWASGTWTPSEDDLSALREAYAETFPVLDQRLHKLVRVLDEAGRWKDSLFVLMSDHGQALGEGGVLFHGLRTAEPLTSVPLWIRPPRNVEVPLPIDEHVSLASVRAAIESMVRASLDERPASAVAAATGLSGEPAPAAALAGGLADNLRRYVHPDRLRRIDRPEVAGYTGHQKLVLDTTTGDCTLIDLDRDPLEGRLVDPGSSNELASLHHYLKSVATKAFSGPVDESASVDSRLASWGYV